MKAYQPPFEITAEITHRIAAICQWVGRLVDPGFSVPPQLRRKNTIKTIRGTLAIEGNTLSQKQVTALIDGKPVVGNLREIEEVKGAIQAYEILPSLDPFQLVDLLNAHKLMMGNLMDHAGSFRKKGVGIQKGDRVIHMAPPAERVPSLIQDLLNWAAHSEHHPLIVSSVFHHEFEFIHPFSDGNGRMGRLWQSLILSKWMPLFLALPLESVIKDNQAAYYQALETSDNKGNCTDFVTFMVKAIETTLEQNAPLFAPVNLTQKAVLELIRRNPEITREELADQIGKHLRTVARAIKALRQQGRLERVGSDKTGSWRVLH